MKTQVLKHFFLIFATAFIAFFGFFITKGLDCQYQFESVEGSICDYYNILIVYPMVVVSILGAFFGIWWAIRIRREK